MTPPIPIIAAFVGGLVSFLSPCVLPIIPGFLGYLGGVAVSGNEPRTSRRSVLLASIFFVLGFSVVFSLFGVLLNALLARATGYIVQLWLARIGGVIIILFGLHLTRLIEIPFLSREHRFAVHYTGRSRALTSFLFGAAFAAGWSPCVGAVLGSIIGIAASVPGSAVLLLFAYSLGLGLPFLLVGIFVSQATSVIARITPALVYLDVLFGFILIVLGVLAFTQNLSLLANFGILNEYLLAK